MSHKEGQRDSESPDEEQQGNSTIGHSCPIDFGPSPDALHNASLAAPRSGGTLVQQQLHSGRSGISMRIVKLSEQPVRRRVLRELFDPPVMVARF